MIRIPSRFPFFIAASASFPNKRLNIWSSSKDLPSISVHAIGRSFCDVARPTMEFVSSISLRFFASCVCWAGVSECCSFGSKARWIRGVATAVASQILARSKYDGLLGDSGGWCGAGCASVTRSDLTIGSPQFVFGLGEASVDTADVLRRAFLLATIIAGGGESWGSSVLSGEAVLGTGIVFWAFCNIAFFLRSGSARWLTLLAKIATASKFLFEAFPLLSLKSVTR